MINKLTVVASIALSSTLMSAGSLAHVKGGALVGGNGNPVSSSYEKCVTSNSGKFFSKCQDIQPKPVVQPLAAPEPAPVVKAEPTKTIEKVEQKISLSGDASFATNSDVLTPAGTASLDALANDISALSDYTINLFGHADSRGSDAYNMKLSERRANAVRDYLVSKGISASAVSAYGRGETEPVASNETREGRAQNRRVDVIVAGNKVVYK